VENFTFQLRGRKRWLLRKSSIPHPLRGCTPHYKSTDTSEIQLKIHRLADASFSFSNAVPTSNDEYEEVVLNEGDSLYFPAGMWHRVECLEDSISVNISLIATTYADVIADSFRQFMYKFDGFRAGINIFPQGYNNNTTENANGSSLSAPSQTRANRGKAKSHTLTSSSSSSSSPFSSPVVDPQVRIQERGHLQLLLQFLKERLDELTADDILPDSIFLPRQDTVLIDLPSNDLTAVAAGGERPAQIYRINPLAVLIRSKDIDGRGGSTGGSAGGSTGQHVHPHSRSLIQSHSRSHSHPPAANGKGGKTKPKEGKEEEEDEEAVEGEEEVDEEDEGDEEEGEGSEEVDDGRIPYVFNLGFGNEGLESSVRVVLRVIPLLSPIVDAVIELVQQSTVYDRIISHSSDSVRHTFSNQQLLELVVAHQPNLGAEISEASASNSLSIVAIESGGAVAVRKGRKRTKKEKKGNPTPISLATCVDHVLSVLASQGFIHAIALAMVRA